jgi:DNA-binding MarR family transcriptional regulator
MRPIADPGNKGYSGTRDSGRTMDIEDRTRWVLSVDRRMLVMREVHENGVIRASEVAHHTGRSVQNISHAIHELESMDMVECITPEKETWKRYVLTEEGKKVYDELREKHLTD